MAAGEIYRALWRHKFFIVAFTAVLIAAAWYLTSRQTPIYEARTLIKIDQRVQDDQDASRSIEVGERLARTYAVVVTTRDFARLVQRNLGGRIAFAEITGNVSAAPVEDLELLGISARSPDRRKAALIANAAPGALIRFIRDAGTPGIKVVPVERAIVPSTPASPNLRLNIAVALLLGLIFNGALALAIDVLSDRLPDSDELEEAIGQPVLATIPTLNFRHRAHEQVARGGDRALESLRSPPGGDEAGAREGSRSRRGRAQIG